MPFSSALAGEYSRMLFSQIVYSGNMTLLAIAGLLNNRYVFRHPELWGEPVTVGFYRGALFRTGGLIVVAITAVGIAMVIPGAGNVERRAMQPSPRKASA